jgi:hypothetical protein
MDFAHRADLERIPRSVRPRRWQRFRRRREADAWIERGHGNRNAWYGWRIDELTSARERRRLARSARGVVADLSPRVLPGAAPLNRVAVRPYAAMLLALADRLEAQERPVRAPGILAARRLLQHYSSPLFTPPAFDEVAGDNLAGPDVGVTIQSVLNQLDEG